MKAYYLSIAGDDDAGGAVVFADTVSGAKKQVFKHESLADSLQGEWIYLRARRDKQYDGMENLSEAELALAQWHDGWRWFDMDYPDPNEATDREFLEWYKNTFEVKPDDRQEGKTNG